MATKKKLLQAAAGSAGGGEVVNIDEVFSTNVYLGNGQTHYVENSVTTGTSQHGGSIYNERRPSSFSASYPDGGNFARTTVPSTGVANAFTIEFWFRPRHRQYPDVDKPNLQGLFNLGDYTDCMIRYSPQASYIWEVWWDTSQYTYNTDVSADTWHHIALTKNGTQFRFFINGSEVISFTSSHVFNFSNITVGTAEHSKNEDMHGHISNIRFVNGTSLYNSNFTPPTGELTAITNTFILTAQGDDPFVDNSGNGYNLTPNNAIRKSKLGPFTSAESADALVWTKPRLTGNNDNHYFIDSVRGGDKILTGGTSTATEFTNSSGIGAFTAAGHVAGSGGSVLDALGQNAKSFVSWTWKKTPKFFDIQTWTGNQTSGRSISHDLGCDPGFIIVRARDSNGQNWSCWHRSLSASTYRLLLNDNGGQGVNSEQSVLSANSTSFTVGSGGDVNGISSGTGIEYVAYLWAHDPDNLISCDVYTGNSSLTGPSIDLGWEPQWVMIKNRDAAGDWNIIDNKRSATSSATNDFSLIANGTNQEARGSNYLNFTANGFDINTLNSGFNSSSTDYVYIAIRNGPMDSIENYEPRDLIRVARGRPGDGYSGAPENQVIGSPFRPDALMGIRGQSGAVLNSGWIWSSRHINRNAILSYGTGGVNTSGGAVEFDTHEFEPHWGDNGGFNDSSYHGFFHALKEHPEYFKMTTYTGTGTTKTVPHGMSVTPEFYFVKRLDTSADWNAYHSGTGASKVMHINTDDAAYNFDTWNYTAPTDTHITVVGSNGGVNYSGSSYILYSFATAAGISKVGSFSRPTTSGTIDCGFTNGVSFVMLKRTDSTGDWLIFDPATGLVTGVGDDTYTSWDNGNGPNQDTTIGQGNFIDSASSGFSLSQDFPSSGSWIFLALAA